MTGINVALMSKTVAVDLLLAALTEHTHLLVQHPLELVGRYVRHTLIKVPLLRKREGPSKEPLPLVE